MQLHDLAHESIMSCQNSGCPRQVQASFEWIGGAHMPEDATTVLGHVGVRDRQEGQPLQQGAGPRACVAASR